MRFRLAPRLMTLEAWMTFNCYKFEFSEISQIWEATTAKRMKIDPCCQRQHCNPVNVLYNIMFLALICRQFLR